jgi:hypothetical protein
MRALIGWWGAVSGSMGGWHRHVHSSLTASLQLDEAAAAAAARKLLQSLAAGSLAAVVTAATVQAQRGRRRRTTSRLPAEQGSHLPEQDFVSIQVPSAAGRQWWQ